MLECLHLRPQFVAFEPALRTRAAELTRLDDERFARVRDFEHTPGGLTVISELVTGHRLIDILETRQTDEAVVSGIDAAFGFMLQAMPALAELHGSSITHGAVAPGRIIVTPNAQVVLLDSIYGAAIERLGLGRQSLWTSFGVMAPPMAGAIPVDPCMDVAQMALCALLLAAGRPLDGAAHISVLATLVREVNELAEIRAGAGFAAGVSKFFNTTLPAQGRRPSVSAELADVAIRRLVSQINEDESLNALAELVCFQAAPKPEFSAHRMESTASRAEERKPDPGRLAAPPMPVEPTTPAVAEAMSRRPAPGAVQAAPIRVTPPAPPSAPIEEQEHLASRVDVAPPPPIAPERLDPPAVAPAAAIAAPVITHAASAAPQMITPVPVVAPPVMAAAPAVAAPVPPPPVAGLAPAAISLAVSPPVVLPPVVFTPPTAVAPPIPVPIPPAAPPFPRPSAPIQIRQDASGLLPVRPRDVRPASEPHPVRALPFVTRPSADEPPTRIPWKLAAAAAVVLSVGLLTGWSYLQRFTNPGTATAASVHATAPPKSAAPAVPVTTGSLAIESQPSGAKVTLNGKDVGVTPLLLRDIDAGRHQLSVSTGSASVQRAVKVEAGEQLIVSVPVFSGWIAIFAPIPLDVSEGRRSLGTTESGKILLPPGRHVLTLANRDLGFSVLQTVDIKPGEESVLNLRPIGLVNLNASPWAEVWVDGTRAGETPLANLEVPLGTREFVFKHPQYGERRLTATITTSASALSVDFWKPPSRP